MEKAFELQKKARDNTNTLQTYLTDLQNWEAEMKRKEAALNGDFEQNLPPVRGKARKELPTKIKKSEQRISASDYQAWEKFDVDKACEDIDMEDVGPVSLDSNKSQHAKLEKLKEEALYEKERGNNFVKQEKWDEAIACYNRAIELVKDDAIYYANRGLCFLKKESLHLAESDCTEALKLDPTYVKALQRRATARERLGSLRAASNDLIEVIKLEPHNAAARRQFEAIKARMGTKGTKSKSSPSATPTLETKSFTTTSKTKVEPKIVEMKDEPTKKIAHQLPTALDNWRNGVGENITVIKPVKKPPHLRSKRSLKSIKIKEIPLGETLEKPPTRMKIIEIEESGQGDTNINDSKKSQDENVEEVKLKNGNDKLKPHIESEKLVAETVLIEKDINAKTLVPPVNSVQFMAEWKYLKGQTGARSDYLSIIDPAKIPSIFENALESDVLSEVLHILHENTDKFREKTIKAYLKALCKVKRFSALAMFLSTKDKEMLANLLDHCKNVENCSDEEISDLKNKYEL